MIKQLFANISTIFSQKSFASSATKAKLGQFRYRILFLLIILIVLAPLLGVLSYSAWAQIKGNVFLEIPGTDIEYGGYETCEMYAEGSPAFCAEPAKDTPRQDVYTKTEITPLTGASGSAHDKQSCVATLWFGWGGPGFDPDLWPKTWYDGSEMNAHRYWALTHIVLSDFYTCDGSAALAGCSEEFCNWALGNVLSYVSDEVPYDARAAQSKIGERRFTVPEEFAESCYQLNTGSTQAILSFESGGWLDLSKKSGNSSITNENDLYSLNKAQYGIYSSLSNAQNDAERITTLITDKNGYAKSSYLERGSYYIKELSPSPGYLLDETIYTAEVKNGKTTRINSDSVFEEPAYDPANLLVQKRDKETCSTTPQGEASLEGAEFQIKYYDHYYSTIDEALNSGEPVRTWVFKTDASGEINLTNSSLLVSGNLYYSQPDTAVLPLGTYLIQETKAPQGYLSNNEISLRTVKQGEGFSAQGSFSPLSDDEAVNEQVIKGGVAFNKLDKETLDNTALGAGELNAVFEIINNSTNSVIVNNQTFKPGDVVYTAQAQKNQDGGYYVSTDTDGDGSDYTLPYGAYRIRETIAGTGYLLSDQEIVFSIRNNGEVVTISNNESFTNQIKRGDLELIKVRESDQARLKGIPFKITSNTTGESHVIITDENGYFSTASSWNDHSYLTNGNDYLLEEANDETNGEGTDGGKALLQEEISDESTNSSGTNNETTSPSAEDSNQIKQSNQSSSKTAESNESNASKTSNNANEAKIEPFFLVSMISHFISQITEGDQSASNEPSLASVQNSSKETNQEKNQENNQEKSQDTNQEGEDSSKASNQKEKDSSKESTLKETGVWFGKTANETITKANDSLGALPYDTYTLEELSCEENQNFTLVKLENITVKKDSTSINLGRIDNIEEAQPLLNTTAKDANDRDKLILASKEASIIDHVEYENLIPEKTYTLKTTVYDNEIQSLLPETNQTLSFNPTSSNGSIDVTFSINALLLGGHSLTVFEELYEGEELKAEHKDPTDSEQTLLVLRPNIATYAFATDEENKQIPSAQDVHVTDKITYENLIPNNEYQLIGFIFDTESIPDVSLEIGDETSEESLQELTTNLSRTNKLIGSTTAQFSPSKETGETSVSFNINTEKLDGKQLVVFEYLVSEEHVIALHNDSEDEKQQLKVQSEIPPTMIAEPTSPSKTSDHLQPLVLVVVLCLASGTAFFAYQAKRKHVKKERVLARITSC